MLRHATNRCQGVEQIARAARKPIQLADHQAPLIFSAKRRAQPASCSASVCACKVWLSVLTLA
jgi:hypothetical protein